MFYTNCAYNIIYYNLVTEMQMAIAIILVSMSIYISAFCGLSSYFRKRIIFLNSSIYVYIFIITNGHFTQHLNHVL